MDLVGWLEQQLNGDWAMYLILFQVILNSMAVALIFFITAYRKGIEKENKEMIPKLQERVTDICVGVNTDIADLKFLKSRYRKVIRGLILSAIGSVSGSYRDNLFKLYQDLGFLKEDRDALLGGSFPTRLAALSRIDTLQDLESGSTVAKMLNDSSPYVHFAALKFLLKVRYPKLHVNMGKELLTLAKLDRMDTALHLLEMYAKGYTEQFLYLLQTHLDPDVLGICLDVVFRLQIAEAMPIVKDQLIDGLRSEGHPEFEQFHFRKYAMCLTVAPDGDTEELLVRMTHVESPTLRNFAYLALIKIRPDLKFDLIERLSFDDSPQGRRLYYQMMESVKGGAA
ncbi:hypothetical protein B9G69_002420 [Bdellovibrio sp. SKB1291214]|uniref:hypothetical protein n=1 Tax=Bdellovibrio sp. SKB1291214 TaxID=1732569 RepID=UPI000B51737C|nr:hypothetical protein [Bdellovibrio sp. SKB1291214]UYL09427.1 hypothetical protein B9G69_002420 [Bdellovibrio sp. SKB1291214]